MNKYILKFLTVLFLFSFVYVKAQDITFIPQDTLLVDTLGAEMIFNIQVTNISMQDQTFYLVRTINDLPPDWQSALCFDFCWAPFLDSIATTPDFQSTPLTPGEMREISVHVFPLNNPGTAHVQIRGGTFRNPDVTYYANLYAVVNPTSVEDENESANNFSLSQNYPNPFNPSTKIKYTVGAQCIVPVQLKVFDMLGREVATLVNEEKEPGNYEVEFDGKNLSSGMYFFRLAASNFTQTRKMILEK